MYNIIREYERVLVGMSPEISKKNFPFDDLVNEKFALSVFRYAIEELLKWSPLEAYRLFTPSIVERMKLTPLLKYICFPSDVTCDDTEYIVHLLYPQKVPYDFVRYTLNIYEQVRAGKRRYPKDFMFGGKGLKRATICLQYALKEVYLFSSLEEMYQYFATPEAMGFLKENKLYQLYCSFYKSPLDFLHYSLSESMRNDFYYEYYSFIYMYKKQYNAFPPGMPENNLD